MDPKSIVSNLFISNSGGFFPLELGRSAEYLLATADSTAVCAAPFIPAVILSAKEPLSPSTVPPSSNLLIMPPFISFLVSSFGITNSPAVNIAGTLSMPGGP